MRYFKVARMSWAAYNDSTHTHNNSANIVHQVFLVHAYMHVIGKKTHTHIHTHNVCEETNWPFKSNTVWKVWQPSLTSTLLTLTMLCSLRRHDSSSHSLRADRKLSNNLSYTLLFCFSVTLLPRVMVTAALPAALASITSHHTVTVSYKSVLCTAEQLNHEPRYINTADFSLSVSLCVF